MANQDTQTFNSNYTDFDDNTFQIRGRTLFLVVVLFWVILCLTLIYLYARWVCRISPPMAGSGIPRLAHAPPLEAAQQRQGLDPNAIGSFPVTLHLASVSPSEAVECSICLGNFQDGEKVKVLPHCRHRYHSECVDAWLRAHSSCPLCRASLRVESPV